jgi:hypothetical protein
MNKNHLLLVTISQHWILAKAFSFAVSFVREYQLNLIRQLFSQLPFLFLHTFIFPNLFAKKAVVETTARFNQIIKNEKKPIL